MSRKRRAFSLEFKQQAVRRVREREAAGVTLAQVGRELGVRPDLLRTWARTLPAAVSRAGGMGPETDLAAEVRRLQRENETLRHERDFAKKAAAYFAKELG